jgi:oligosaccharide repeat unit polymerase
VDLFQRKMSSFIFLKKNTAFAFASFFLYRVVLDLSYFFVISRSWSYALFDLKLDLLKLIESYLLLFLIFIVMPKSKERVSSIFIWISVICSYVPMLTLFAFADKPRLFMYAATGFWLLVFLFLKLPNISVVFLKKNQSKIILYLIFLISFLSVSLILYKNFHFSLNFDLTKVYEIRSQYKDIRTSLIGYLFPWVAYIINPVALAFFLSKRKCIPMILIIILQLFLFSVTGKKSFLFILPFLAALIWMVRRKNPLCYFCLGLICVIISGMLSYRLVNDTWISSLFIRRTLFVPARLSFLYYDFFSSHSHTFLSQHRIFENILIYPYQLTPPMLIADAYFNKPEMNANNGIYADAYMNFGFVGFLLWSSLLALVLKLIDVFSARKKTTIAIVAIAMPTLIFSNAAFLTTLLTHGLLLSLLILYLLPAEEK